VAVDNSYGAAHNVQLTVNAADGTITGTLNGVLADYDPDNSSAGKLFDDTLSVTARPSPPSTRHGRSHTDGSFTYTPYAANTTGTDSFEYTLLDNLGAADTGLVTLNLTNAAPVAVDNSYGAAHNVQLTVNADDGTITGTLNGVLADYDPDNSSAGKLFDDTCRLRLRPSPPSTAARSFSIPTARSPIRRPRPTRRARIPSSTPCWTTWVLPIPAW